MTDNPKNKYESADDILTSSGLDASDLRQHFKGQVIVPGDPGYEEGRLVMNGGIDRHPAVIIRPVSAEEVAQVVSLARDTGLPLAVRSGGHSAAGYGTVDGGIVLDLRNMRALKIDVEGHTAYAETGLTTGEYTNAAGAHGLATGFGDTGSVGIGGITLGGGIGYLTRKYGMTIDNLLSAEVVTADGRIIRTSGVSNPDLFWAIRGGGGNFGVATQLQYRLHVVDEIFGGILILPAMPEVIAGSVRTLQAASDDLSAILNIMPAPPMPFIPPEAHGKPIVMVMVAFDGPAETGAKAVAPLRGLAKPIVDMVRPIHYPEMFPPEEPGFRPKTVTHTMFAEKIDREDAETILHYLQLSDSPMRAAQLRVLGGAMARVSSDATAFAYRQEHILVNLATFYTDADDRVRRLDWLNKFANAISQDDSGVYVNFLEDEGEARVRAAYPETTWDRLAAVKVRYDPGNLFRINQNIPPAV